MKVRVISVTQPLFKNDLTPEELLIYIARVSSGKSDDEKLENIVPLIKYLIKNRHWSPFEMVGACVEITTSRAIAQQILRHRSFSYQEFSQRYAIATRMEPIELRQQAEKNRQSSEDEVDPVIPYKGDTIRASEALVRHLDATEQLHHDLLQAGVAKETARFIMPLCTETTLYMHGTLRSWIHYLELRDDEHAQLEHQRIASEIKYYLRVYFPYTWEALGW